MRRKIHTALPTKKPKPLSKDNGKLFVRVLFAAYHNPRPAGDQWSEAMVRVTRVKTDEVQPFRVQLRFVYLSGHVQNLTHSRHALFRDAELDFLMFTRTWPRRYQVKYVQPPDHVLDKLRRSKAEKAAPDAWNDFIRATRAMLNDDDLDITSAQVFDPST
jgi:hypothetical protein